MDTKTHDDSDLIESLAWTKITPKGIRRKSRNIGEIGELAKKTYSQIKNILVFEKKRVGFGSVLGSVWLFLDPILHTALYYFIVVIISGSGNIERLLKIAIAVLAWRIHTRMISQASRLFGNKIGQLSQIYYPIQLIILEFLFVNLMLFSYSMLGPFLILAANGVYPNFHWLWFLVIFSIQMTLTMAISTIVSVIGVFIKDLQNILFFPLAVWWYASPAIYDLSAVPEKYQSLLSLNPFASIFEAYFDVMLYQQAPVLAPLLLIFAVSAVLLILGVNLLGKARYYFYKYL